MNRDDVTDVLGMLSGAWPQQATYTADEREQFVRTMLSFELAIVTATIDRLVRNGRVFRPNPAELADAYQATKRSAQAAVERERAKKPPEPARKADPMPPVLRRMLDDKVTFAEAARRESEMAK